ncbi:MAG: DUF2905 domain-containing protein [Chloroflexi bacterium]|nr:DUF2905 domain-containing protein [Chloroflexota bacterium]
MELASIGKLLIVLGIGAVLIGGLFLLFSRIPGLKHFGHLPGDIRMQGQNFACFFPVVSMILLSIILTIVLNVLVRLFNR